MWNSTPNNVQDCFLLKANASFLSSTLSISKLQNAAKRIRTPIYSSFPFYIAAAGLALVCYLTYTNMRIKSQR